MRFLVGVVCVMSLSACSMFMHSIERPTAEVRNVSVSSAGWSGVTGELRLDVMNPNSFGVPLAGIDWELSIGGTRAVTGTVELSQTIPAKGVAPVVTTLSIAARDAIAVGSVLAGGARNYTISARLRFSTAVGPLAVDIQGSGTLGQAIAGN